MAQNKIYILKEIKKMKKVNFNNEMKTRYNQYIMSDNYNLWDVYSSFSRAKAEAFKYCQNLCKEYNGQNLKILTASRFVFTAGFTYTDNDNKKHFVLITKSKDLDTIIIE